LSDRASPGFSGRKKRGKKQRREKTSREKNSKLYPWVKRTKSLMLEEKERKGGAWNDVLKSKMSQHCGGKKIMEFSGEGGPW